MSTLLAVDPGLRHCGCALFGVGGLLQARLVVNTEKKIRGPKAHAKMSIGVNEAFPGYGVDHLVLEYPRIYPNHSNKRSEDPNDCLELAGVDGAIASFYLPYPTKIGHVFPADWKGQVPKAVMIERIKKTLTPEETKRVVLAGAKSHNIWDAVGIGLFHLGRL